jgi:DNA (cytosine-5)-methyltransferase 1
LRILIHCLSSSFCGQGGDWSSYNRYLARQFFSPLLLMKKFAYYNEWDKKAAEWLRQLIKLGAIAPGEVDDRSITDIKPDDLRGFAQIHLFAGIGGWSLALRQAGWDDDRPVWTGSAPCQPFSSSGKQLGFADKRHLWGEMFRLVRELRPEYVFGEQVASKIALAWWDAVANDLESAGYAAAAVDLSGGSAGAPHVRSRLYWLGHKLGHAPGDRQQWGRETGTLQEGWESEPGSRGQLPEGSQRSSIAGSVADTDGSVPAIGIDRVSSQGDAEIGRLTTAANRGSSPASIPVATFWNECEWVDCRDGKRRPTGVGINPLAGVPSLDREYIRIELERCAQRLFSDWDDGERSQKAQAFARLILEAQNVGSIKSRLYKVDDGLSPDLVSSCDISTPDCDNTQIARIVRLKGYGNSLVAPLASEFIRSVMDCLDKH